MISTPELQIPEYIIDILKKSGCEYSCSSSLEEAISSLDVLYMTRIQQERFKSEEEYERQKGVYVLDEEKMKPVSYTHLDVYKRQFISSAPRC